jgi:hypothetical protein
MTATAPTAQTEFTASVNSGSQNGRILAELNRLRGQWVPMPQLVKVSGSYVIHSRVADLRRAGCDIQQHNVIIQRQCHSYYALTRADGTTDPKPTADTISISPSGASTKQ